MTVLIILLLFGFVMMLFGWALVVAGAKAEEEYRRVFDAWIQAKEKARPTNEELSNIFDPDKIAFKPNIKLLYKGNNYKIYKLGRMAYFIGNGKVKVANLDDPKEMEEFKNFINNFINRRNK